MQSQKSPQNSNVDKLNTSSEDIERLLEAYTKHQQLFLFTVAKYDLRVIFRPLTIAEQEGISKLHKVCMPFGIEDWIISNTVVYSSADIDQLSAGTATKVANTILKASSIKDDKDYRAMLNVKRNGESTLDFLVCATINKAYPTVNVYDMNYSQQTKLLAVAENMIGTKLMIGEENNKKKRRGPAVPDGYTSIGKSEILSPENADKPDFKSDNAAMMGL